MVSLPSPVLAGVLSSLGLGFVVAALLTFLPGVGFGSAFFGAGLGATALVATARATGALAGALAGAGLAAGLAGAAREGAACAAGGAADGRGGGGGGAGLGLGLSGAFLATARKLMCSRRCSVPSDKGKETCNASTADDM